MDPGIGRPVVSAREGYLRLCFDADARPRWADFHYTWLRHHCPCCRHPQTGERLLCSSTLPPDARPAAFAVRDGELILEWKEAGGGHVSRYPLEWLRENAYAPEREEVAPPLDDARRIEIAAAPPADDLARRCLEQLARDGAVVARGAGDDTEALIRSFEAQGLSVTATHFGRIEDLRTDNTTNQNIDQLGYTDAAVDLHTDQPFIERPPRYQLLHCMRPATHGGENALADGLQAARHLRSLDAPAFELLTSVPVGFDRRQAAFESLQERPIVELRDGEPHQVRASYFTYGPHRMDFAVMEAWYRAYARFVAILTRHPLRLRLEAGDFLLYDNHRMLHARSAFQGARWLRGVYFDKEADSGVGLRAASRRRAKETDET